MNTSRIDICYRPVRVAWAIKSDDMASLRYAIRVSHTLWGGRFNPIVVVDYPEATDIVSLFRADFIIPVGTSDEVQAFANNFSYLANPLSFGRLLGQGRPYLLDIYNAFTHWREKPAWRDLHELGMGTFCWDEDDPLADMFLIQFGQYPSKTEVGIDYLTLLSQVTPVTNIKLEKKQPLPVEIFKRTNISILSRFGLTQNYIDLSTKNFPGIYAGRANDFRDLTTYWNLRAANIQLMFVDLAQLSRYKQVLPRYKQILQENVRHLPEHRPGIATWTQLNYLDAAQPISKDIGGLTSPINEQTWLGNVVSAPMMILGKESALGVMGVRQSRPTVSFALLNKPFNDDRYFFNQHLVASVSAPILFADTKNTFWPPYVPELNGFLGREMGVQYNQLRVEPDSLGVIIDATDQNLSLSALSNNTLAEKLFEMCDIQAKVSSAGLITRQLIAQFGGIDKTRVLKISGVRDLIKAHGLNKSFTKEVALQHIGKKISNHLNLYIEPRAGGPLKPESAFAQLVERGLFRIGMELTCSTCNLENWVPLEQLKQHCECELCGAKFDATRQIVISGRFRYRRSGVLGLEKNAHGAIPVAVLLQQMFTNIQQTHLNSVFLPSFDLIPRNGVDLPHCEVDFFGIVHGVQNGKTQIVIGECKDNGGSIDEKDVRNLGRIADAFPKHRFEVFIMFAKLSAFTLEEICAVKTLNKDHQSRVILLTDQELEPYHLFERSEEKLGNRFSFSLEEISLITTRLYLEHEDTAPSATLMVI